MEIIMSSYPTDIICLHVYNPVLSGHAIKTRIYLVFCSIVLEVLSFYRFVFWLVFLNEKKRIF